MTTDIEISVQELHARLERGETPRLLDVREPAEWDIGHLPGAELLPLGELGGKHATLAGEAEIICICHHGQRSLWAADFLRQAGVPNARSLAGGLDAWARKIDAAFPRY